ncbi:MAG: fused MFS/spermidine synthase [Myxococcales bacterium]|nr:fused MFS/spermidine synthase [Myxococcales bacterium]
MSGADWFVEKINESCQVKFLVNQRLAETESSYQQIDFVDTASFGVVLFLDGVAQSCEKDEFIYHELLCHPALLHHPNPRSVFIMGGGEGSTAREILKHRGVERVVMSDIDEKVIELSKKFFTANKNSWKDKRLRIEVADAKLQLKKEGRFDLIISDLADPVVGGPCYELYTKEFYQSILRDHLNPGGILLVQSSAAGAFTCQDLFTPIHNTLCQVFPRVVPYADLVPSFSDKWGWNLCFSDASMDALSAEEFDQRVQRRLGDELRYLDGVVWQNANMLDKLTRKAIEEEEHVLSLQRGANV